MANENRSLRSLVTPAINRLLKPLVNRAAPTRPKIYRPEDKPFGKVLLWVVEHATEEEKVSYWRVIRAGANKFSPNARNKITDSDWRKLIGDTLEIQPEDTDVLKHMRDRMPKVLQNAMRF